MKDLASRLWHKRYVRWPLVALIVMTGVATLFIFRAKIPGYTLAVARQGTCSEKARLISGNTGLSKVKYCHQEKQEIGGQHVTVVWYAFHDSMDFEDPFYCGSSPEDYRHSCAALGVIDEDGRTDSLPNDSEYPASEVLSKHGCWSNADRNLTQTEIMYYEGQYWKNINLQGYQLKTDYGVCIIDGSARGNNDRIVDGLSVTYSFDANPCENAAASGYTDGFNCIRSLSLAKQDVSLCQLLGRAPFNLQEAEFPAPEQSCMLQYAVDSRDASICKLLPNAPTAYDPQKESNKESCELTLQDRKPIILASDPSL